MGKPAQDHACGALVEPDQALKRLITDLDGDHDASVLMRDQQLACELESGHASLHGRSVQTAAGAPVESEHWLLWTGGSAPALEVLPVCPAQDATGEVLCVLHLDHAGAHSGLDEWWS